MLMKLYVFRLLEGLLGRAERAREDAEGRAKLAEERLRQTERMVLETNNNNNTINNNERRNERGRGFHQTIDRYEAHSTHDSDEDLFNAGDDDDDEEVVSRGVSYTRSMSSRGTLSSNNTNRKGRTNILSGNPSVNTPQTLVERLDGLDSDAWDDVDINGLQRAASILELTLARVRETKEKKVREKEREEEIQRKKQLREGEMNSLCCICRDSPKSVLLLPCRHLCVCENCCSHYPMDKCPVCRSTVSQQLKVYA